MNPNESVLTPNDPAGNPEAVPKARSAYSRSILNLLFYALFGQILVIAAVSVFELITKREPQGTVYYLIHFIPMYLIAFPLYLLLSKPMESFPPEKHSLSVGQFICSFLISIGLGVIGAFIGLIVTVVIGLFTGYDTGTHVLEEGLSSEGATLLTLIASLAAPVVEEMLFRKILIDRIRKYGEGTAIFLSGFLFGLFHGNFSQFFFAAMLGMFFAFIYIRNGKIHYTILLHCIINTLSTAIAGPIVSKLDMDPERILEAVNNMDMDFLHQYIPLVIYMLCYYGAALAGLILLLIYRRQLKVAPPAVRLPKGTQFRTACINLGFVLFILFCIAMFVITALQNG